MTIFRMPPAPRNAAFRRFAVTLLAGLLVAAYAPFASAASAAPRDESGEAKTATVIDEVPLATARSLGMAGAIAPIADDLDAAFNNPAGIGGRTWDGTSVPLARKVYFPWLEATANKNSLDLVQDLRGSEAATDKTVGKGIIDAHAGERQFARASFLSGVVLGRTMVVPFADVQMAATAREGGAEDIDAHYRFLRGIGAGASVQDPEGRLMLGYFGTLATRTDTVGTFAYDDFVGSATPQEGSETRAGVSHNFGMNLRLAKTAMPTLAVAVKNAGGTRYSGDGEAMTVRENISAGLSVSPRFGKSTYLNLVAQGDELGNVHVSTPKKLRAGVELTFGGFGSYATLGLRAGANYAGLSYGGSLNLGLVGFEAAVSSVDIGLGNDKVVEQRYTGTAYVNVAEF
jgi:hypothetical protein